MTGPRRVIVGASGSPGSLCALRYAGYLASATGATLMPVLVWTQCLPAPPTSLVRRTVSKCSESVAAGHVSRNDIDFENVP